MKMVHPETANARNLQLDQEREMPLLRPFRALLLWALGTWIGLILLLGCAVYFFPQETLTVESGNVKADAIVVLGGGRDDRPVRASQLFKQGAAPRILVSGFGDYEANVIKLEENGIPLDVISQETRSKSTFENAEFSVPLLRQMGAKRVIIVTSWYHSRRALTCFEHFAPDIEFYSRPSYFDYQLNIANRKDVNENVLWEYIKLNAYWLLHGISPLYYKS